MTSPATIPALFTRRCPATIARLVIAVVVWIAVNGVAQTWAQPNVRNEIFKRFSPAIADMNSATAISIKSTGIGIVAPLDNAFPDIVAIPFSKALGFTRIAVRATTAASQASARFDELGSQRRSAYTLYSAAFTRADDDPIPILIDLVRDFLNRQEPKFLSDNGHRSYNAARHSSAPFSDGCLETPGRANGRGVSLFYQINAAKRSLLMKS